MQQLDNACDLPREMTITIGAPVIITQNLNTKAGLFNGSEGVVHRVVLNEDSQVECIEVQLAGTDVVRTIRRVKQSRRFPGGAFITRRMFPMLVGFARTVHRCQGDTFTTQNVYVDITGMDKIVAMGYVACSRPKKLQQLRFLPCGTQLTKSMFRPHVPPTI